jgi:hypothetical protein
LLLLLRATAKLLSKIATQQKKMGGQKVGQSEPLLVTVAAAARRQLSALRLSSGSIKALLRLY